MNGSGVSSVPALSRGQRWAAAAVLAASLLVITMDMTVLNVALPSLASDLRPSATAQLWIIDVYSLTLAGLLVPMSALADRWGRKCMLLTGYAVFAGSSALIFLSPHAGAVIAVRAVLGVGGAMVMPTTLSLIRDIFKDAGERAQALGVWAAVASLGAAVGPIVGGLLLEHFTWRAAFLVNVPLMVAAIGAGLLLLPESRSPQPAHWDIPATFLSIGGMVSLIWGIKEFTVVGGLHTAPWVLIAAGLSLLGLFTIRCLRQPHPLLDIRLFTRLPVTGSVVAALLATFGMAAVLLLGAQWLQFVQGYGPLQAGLHLLPLSVGAIIFSSLAPWLAGRLGVRRVLVGGLLLAGVGFVALWVAAEITYPVMLITLLLLGAGAGSLALATAIIMAETPPEKAGDAAAIEETAYDLGNVLGVAVLGSVAAKIYRDGFDVSALVTQGMPLPLVALAEESLGGALAIAQELGSAELAATAKYAFTASLATSGLVAALVLMVAAIVVFLLVPKDLNVTRSET